MLAHIGRTWEAVAVCTMWLRCGAQGWEAKVCCVYCRA